MECYKSWNGRESVLASMLSQTYGDITRDRVMSYIYSDEFEQKFGNFKSNLNTKIPVDEIGSEPTAYWISENVLNLSQVLLNPERGIELKPGIFANAGQEEAIKNIEKFLEQPSGQATIDNMYLLEGGAGVGKTTSINKALEGFKGKIIGATVSDEARGVLQQNMVGKTTLTIAKLLGLVADRTSAQLVFRKRNKEEEQKFRAAYKQDPIETAKLVIIDEASMVDKETWDLLQELTPKGTKVIFLGDRTQLPPIGEDLSNAFKALEETPRYSKLTETMRFQQGAPIFGITESVFADNIRGFQEGGILRPNPMMDHPIEDHIENGEAVLYRGYSKELIDNIVEEYKQATSAKDVVVIADKNDSVKALNTMIRKGLLPDATEEYQVGERVRMAGPYTVDGMVVAENNLKGIIDSKTAGSVNGVPVTNYRIKFEKINTQGKVEEKIVTIPVVAEEDKPALKARLNELAEIAKKNRSAWGAYYSLKESFAEIDYAYAMTVHKVQGSTYKNVYVMAHEIYRPNSPRTGLEKNQMMRTATSRATTKLVYVTDATSDTSTTMVEIPAGPKPVLPPQPTQASTLTFKTEDEAISAVEGFVNGVLTNKKIKTGTVISIDGKLVTVVNDDDKDLEFIPVEAPAAPPPPAPPVPVEEPGVFEEFGTFYRFNADGTSGQFRQGKTGEWKSLNDKTTKVKYKQFVLGEMPPPPPVATTQPIAEFQGEHRWLSNFEGGPVTLDGIQYPTVEHAYQAAKSLDPKEREIVKGASTPGAAKQAGKKVTIRPDWDQVKISVMEDLLRQKFAEPTLKAKLIATGNVDLIEGNNWGDTFWGVSKGKGENNLGKLLMKIRSELQNPVLVSKVKRTDTIITRAEVKANPTTLYIFGDNNTRGGLGGQAKEMRGEPNAVGVSTKKYPGVDPAHYMTDTELEENMKVISADIDKVLAEWNTGKYTALHIPQIGVGKAELPTRAPKTWAYLQVELKRLEDLVNNPQVQEPPAPPAELQPVVELKIPKPTTRVKNIDRPDEAYDLMKERIKKTWIEPAQLNPNTIYQVGYKNPAADKFADDNGFYTKEYAQIMDEIRREMGDTFPKNIKFYPAFEYAMNNSVQRILDVFSTSLDEREANRTLWPIDPLVTAEMNAKMEIAIVGDKNETINYFTRKHGSNAQSDIADALLQGMYTGYLKGKAKPLTVDKLFENALRAVNGFKVMALKEGNQARAEMWEDVRKSFAFPAQDARLSFTSILIDRFKQLNYKIESSVTAKLLNKYSKLKNDPTIVETNEEILLGTENYFAAPIEDMEDDFDGDVSRGTSVKDWRDSAFELDHRQTPGTRLKMWLSIQLKKEQATYEVLQAIEGLPLPPDVIDITSVVTDPSQITIGQAMIWKGQRIAHQTLRDEIAQVLEERFSSLPIRNSIGLPTLLAYEDLYSSILDVTASVPGYNLEKAVAKLNDSGNPNLMETARRLQAETNQVQNEFLKVTNLQYGRWKVIKMDSKVDSDGETFMQVRLIDAQQYNQTQTILKKWKEQQIVSPIMKLKADGSRVIDLAKTRKQLDVIEILGALGDVVEKGEDFKNELQAKMDASKYFQDITVDDLLKEEETRHFNDKEKGQVRQYKSRKLQAKILQTMFAEHGIILNDDMIKQLTGTRMKGTGKNAEMIDRVQDFVKGKLEGNWASQFSFTREGKPNGIFSAFFAKAAGVSDVNDIDPEVTEELEQLVMENNPLYTENTTMKVLGTIARKFTPILHSNAHRNIEGKQIYDYAYPTSLSTQVDALKEDFEEVKRKYLATHLLGYINPDGDLVSGNWYLDQLDPQQFNVQYFEGLNYGSRAKGTTRSGMSDREQLLSVVNDYLNSGLDYGEFFSLTHSDKTMTPLFNHVPKFKVSDIADNLIGLNVQDHFYQIFEGEYRRAKHVQSLLSTKGTTGNAKLDQGGTFFYFLPMFNFDEATKLGIAPYFYKPDGTLREEIEPGGKAAIMTEINKFLEKEVAIETENWKNRGVEYSMLDRNYTKKKQKELDGTNKFGTLSKLKGKDDLSVSTVKQRNQIVLDHAIKEYRLNTLLWNMSSAMLFYGDPAQTFKRNVKDTWAEYAKRLAKDIAPGSLPNFANPYYNSLTLADVTEYYKYINKFGSNIQKSEEAANAQELTTVQEHLDVMMASGLIEDGLYEELLGVIAKNPENYEFTPEQIDRMMQPMQAMKPVYTGFRNPSDGFMIYDYIKTSSYPLLPQFTKTMELDKVRKMMESNNVQRAVFLSGQKMGAKADLVQLFTDDGKYIEPKQGEIANQLTKLDRKNFRIQQDVPYDEDKEHIKIVSQMNKLIVEGIEDIKDFEIPGVEGTMTGKEIRKYKEDVKARMIKYNLQKFYKKIGITQYEDGSLSTIDKAKVIAMMVEEAKSRGYSINEIALIERVIEHKTEDGKVYDTEFDFPLFNHPAVEKFESLVMSLIRKITEFKMPGKSYVQASSVGYSREMIKEQGAINVEGIVFVGDYNGSEPLKHMHVDEKTGKVQPAQVFAPFNFFIDGKKAKVEDFLIPGSRQLDMTRVPKELLQLVGARIPNQGHNSMVAIEIVGFVPDELGDLLIVPAAITEQMGSDFDVDKLYTYKRPYFYSNVTKGFTQEFKGERLGANEQEYNELVDDTKVILETLGEKMDEQGQYRNDMWTMAFTKAVSHKYPDGNVPRHEIERAAKEVEELQKEYFNVHWSILTHRDMYTKVMNKLDKPDLKEANKRFEVKKEQGSFWSSQTQQEMFQAGKDAKTLVALTSLAVTFNSVIQDKNLRLGTFVWVKGFGWQPVPQSIELNGKKFTRLSGNGKSRKNPADDDSPVYTKGDNHTIFQSGAVDNAKDRTLDNLDITLAVYPALQALHQLETDNGEILNTDFSTAMMVQEIIWKYSREMRQGNDSMSEEYQPDLAQAVYDKLRDELLTQYKAITGNSVVESQVGNINLTTDLMEKAWDQWQEGRIKDGQDVYILRQLKVLDTFRTLSTYGERLGQLQKTLNQDTNGAGPNLLYAGQQMENYLGIQKDHGAKIFLNEDSLLYGSEQDQTFKAIIPLAIKLGESLFPLEAMKEMITQIAINRNQQVTELSLTIQKDLVRELRSAILSSSPMLGQDSTAERVRLLYGTNTQKSLAIRLDEYKKKVNSNYFLERLHTKVNTNGKGPDTIEFVAAPSARMDDVLNVTDFQALLQSPDPLERTLGEDLVKYALLLTPQAGPNSFINKVPSGVLLGTSFAGDMRAISEQLNAGGMLSGLVDQVYQHMPSLALDITAKDLETNYEMNKIPGRTYPELYTFPSGANKKLMNTTTLGTVYTPFVKFFDKAEGKVILYKLQISNGALVQYQRIDTLGTKKHVEYNLDIAGINRSIFTNNQAGLAFGTVDPVFQVSNEVEQKINRMADPNNAYTRWGIRPGGEEVLDSALEFLAGDKTVPTYLRTLAKAFTMTPQAKLEQDAYQDLLGNRPPLQITTEGVSKGGTYSLVDNIINLSASAETIFAAETLVHETIHYRTGSLTSAFGWDHHVNRPAMTTEQNTKWDQTVEHYRKTYPEVYEKLKALDRLRLEAFIAMNKKVTAEGKDFKAMVKRVNNKTVTEGDEQVLYALTNIDEFITGVQTSAVTMEFLNGVQSKSKKSLFDRIIQSVLDLFAEIAKMIGPIKDGSILKEALELAYHVTSLNDGSIGMTNPDGTVNPGTYGMRTEQQAELAKNNVEGIQKKISNITTNGITHNLAVTVNNVPLTMSARVSFVLAKLDKQLRTLEGVIGVPPRTPEDEVRNREAKRLHQEILEDRNTLSATKDLTELAEIGEKQLKWVKEVLAKPNNHLQEITMASSILDTWINMKDIYKEQFTSVDPNFQRQVFGLNEASILLFNTLRPARAKTLINMGRFKGVEIVPSDLSKGLVDVRKDKQMALALSRDGNKLTQFLSVYGQEAANNEQEAQNELKNRMNKIVKAIGTDQETYMKFIQENTDGTAFGLVQELHPDWYNARSGSAKDLDKGLAEIDATASFRDKDPNKRAQAIRIRKKIFAKFWDKMNSVGEALSPVKLFDQQTGERLSTPESLLEYSRLLAYTGSKEVLDDAISNLETTMQRYIVERDSQFEYYDKNTLVRESELATIQNSLNSEQRTLPEDEQKQLIGMKVLEFLEQKIQSRKIGWELRNSPAAFLTTASQKEQDQAYQHSGRYKPTFIPRKGADMFDSKYVHLMEQDSEGNYLRPELANAYKEFVHFSKLYRSYLPPKISDRLHENFLPIINIHDVASMLSMFDGLSTSNIGTKFMDAVAQGLTVSEYEKNRKDSDEIPIKYTGGVPKTEDGKVDFSKLSIDLPRVFEMFGNMAIHYHYMYPIKEMIDVIDKLVLEESTTRQNDGEKGLNNLSELIDYYKDMLVLQKPIAVEGVSAQPIYSSNPVKHRNIKKRVQEIHTRIAELEGQEMDIEDEFNLNSGIESELGELRAELKELMSDVRYLAASTIGDTLIGINQLKAMSYNPFSAITNFTFGHMASYIYARGFRVDDKDKKTTKGDYTVGQLNEAGKLMKGNALRSWGGIFGYKGDQMANKCKAIIDRVGMVEALIDTKYGKTNLEAYKKSAFKRAIDPFAWQKSGDFMTKGKVVIAMALNKQVEVEINGQKQQISLFDALDEEGKWNEAEFGPRPEWYSEDDKDIKQQEWNRFRDKVRKVGLIVFGNQDRNAPLYMRKHLIGRLAGQFRLSWIPEGYNTRFGKEYFDEQLGRKVSGRYANMWTMRGKGIPLLMKQVASVFTGSDAFEGEKTLQWDTVGGQKQQVWKDIQDHEKENMRRNLAGMSYTLMVLSASLILKSLLPDDEEMKRRRRAGKDNSTSLRLAINILYRTQQDLMFYSSPYMVDQVFGNPIPAWSVVKDGLNAVMATAAIAMEEDPDFEKLLLKWTKVFPYTNLINKTKFMMSRDISGAVR